MRVVLFIFMSIYFENANSQTRFGRVLDGNKNIPIDGAEIFNSSTKQKSISKNNGYFSINANLNNELIISCIGYKNKFLKVQSKDTLFIYLMTSTDTLNEVIVVGFGVKKKSSNIGAISVLSGKELENKPVDNISNLIGGRITGVITRQQSGVPGENASSIIIRGINSPNSLRPLVIVDGIERPFENLDPSEIETFTVLKDAASAAVYGVRGGNGVILVTTKKGGTNQKISLQFNTNLTFQTNTNFPKFPDGVDFAKWRNKALILDGLKPDYSDDDINKIQNGDTTERFGNTKWTELLFKDYAPQQFNNLNIYGSSGKIRFFNNIGYLNQDGVINGVNFKRVNIRSNLDYDINSNITLTLNLAARQEIYNQPATSPGSFDIDINNYQNLIYYAILGNPTRPAFLKNGTPIGWSNVIVARDNSGFYKRTNNIFQSNFGIKFSIPSIKGLTLKYNFSYDNQDTKSKRFSIPNKMGSWERTTDINQNVIWRLQSFWRLYPFKDGTSASNILSQDYYDYQRYTHQATIDYAKIFNIDHTLNVLFVYEEQGTITNSHGLSGQDLPLTTIPELNYASSFLTQSIYGSTNRSGFKGLVSRLNYTFKNKYFLEFTSRIDWSTKFAPDKRQGIFPAISMGWQVSKENFFEKSSLSDFISNLKIKVSAGILGNDNIGDFKYLKLFNLSSNPNIIFGNSAYFDILRSEVPNYNITWEKVTAYNVGLELGILKDLLFLEFDYFYKTTTDILQNQAGFYPPSYGGNFPATVNQGVMEIKGYELSLKHLNKINKDFNYGLTFNLTFAKNKWIQYNESPNIPYWQRVTGQSYGSVLGFISEGLFQNETEIKNAAVTSYGVRPGDIKYKDLNGDGKIDFADRTWISTSPVPEYIGSFTIDLNYKNFNLNLFFQGAFNTYIFLSGDYKNAGFSEGTFFTQPFKWGANTPYYMLENSWQKEGDKTEFARLTTQSPINNNITNDFWKRDASYLRLKTAQIVYTIPTNLYKNTFITGINIYISGTNLFTITGLKFIDPEGPTVSNGFYPQQKIYNIGLNIKF